MRGVRKVLSVVAKDLKIEFRSRELLSTMFFFAFIILLVFKFSLGRSGIPPSEIGAGLLWISFTMAGIFGLSRSVEIEGVNDCLSGLLLSPFDRTSLFLGKLLVNFIRLSFMECGVLLLAALLMGIAVFNNFWLLLLVIALNTFGFATVGTLFSLIVARAGSGNVLLTVLQFPVIIPLLIAAVHSTEGALEGLSLGDVSDSIKISVVFCIIMFAVSTVIFEFALED